MTNRSTHGLLVALALLGAAAPARAQRSVDVALFRPALDAYGIGPVERADTAPQWSFGFSLWGDYAANPLRLSMRDGTAMPPRTTTLIDRQIVLDFGVHLGLTDWLEVAADLPLSAQHYTDAYGTQGSAGDPMLARTGFYAPAPRTNMPPPDAAPLDARVALKARLLRTHNVGLALAAVVTLPFGNDTAFLGEGAPTFRPVLVADWTRGPLSVAVNAGAIVRKETRVLDPYDVAAGAAQPRVLLDVGDELTWSAAVAWRFSRLAGVAATAFGRVPLVQSASAPGDAGRDDTADVLGLVQLFPSRSLAITVGGGAGVVPSARRHDDFRVVLGLGWTPTTGGARDADGDGVPDGEDLCPNAPEDRDGFEDGDGCPDPDNDGDGIPDGADACPNDPEDRDSFQDDDGCPDPDNDGDGIPDAQDHCPNEPEDRDGFADDDGCPDLDNDGDGIADAQDRCPDEPETKNGIDDDDGCPDSGALASTAAGPLTIGERIAFGSREVDVPARFKALLDRIADRILAHREVAHVRIEGHADDLGSERINREVAQARAEAVRNYLIGRGVEPERLQAVGYGGTRPLDRRRTREARARNRRVEFVVVEQTR